MVCHAEMFHDYVLSISHYVPSWLVYMICKLHDDDDESNLKTRTCIVASIVFMEFKKYLNNQGKIMEFCEIIW